MLKRKRLKKLALVSCCFVVVNCCAQSLQLHQEFRHAIEPKSNTRNYRSLYFEWFKSQDSGKAFIKPGSILFKMQADLNGSNGNIGQVYTQVAEKFRCWQAPLYIHLSYSGGLGVTIPAQYSFYIANTWQAGVSYSFQWKGAYYTTVLDFKWVGYHKPTTDFIYTFYFYKGFFNYRAEFSGDFSLWTENKDHDGLQAAGLKGKRFFLFAEPQIWYRIAGRFYAGSKVNTYYHVYTNSNSLQIYPTAALKWKL